MVEQSDGALWESVLAAEIHPLLCALALLTNDHALIDPRFSPIVELPAAGPPPHWGLSDAMVDEARLRAFEHLRGIRDRARDLECDPSPSMLERTLEFAVGRDHGVSAGLIRRELDLPHDPEAPDWCAEHIATGRTFRVAIIGAGMSGILVAHRLVASVVVFQRNPPWMLPTPRYHETITAAHRRLLGALPHYARWLRFFQVWATIRGRWDLVRVDETYQHAVSVSAANEALRQSLLQQMERHYADRPDLLRSQVPNYPPGAKRMLRDNGVWPAALKDPKVFVETRPIAGISSGGVTIVAEGGDVGKQHPLDVLIYATGFRASEFLMPMEITGLHGRKLHEWWNGEARAYLGMCMPGFPNFFCMYGPNTNLVVHGSLILFAESSANFIMQCIKMLLEKNQQSMMVTEQAF
ncbi:MAG: hypothetical protein EBV65_11000, partial [Gammaproteobacteria bacterium]|nr:hypothetical protein [Gammaproteobacteria bacterium]